jgi:hypothetical protein
MAEKKNDNIMQHDGVEVGYFHKRKDAFNKEFEKGFNGKKAEIPKQRKPQARKRG